MLDRTEAPSLHALIDHVAEFVQCPAPAVAIDGNFSLRDAGSGRHRVLVLGLPLWNVLKPQERVAMLSHELAHMISGDVRRGAVIGSALRRLHAAHRHLSTSVVSAESKMEAIGFGVMRDTVTRVRSEGALWSMRMHGAAEGQLRSTTRAYAILGAFRAFVGLPLVVLLGLVFVNGRRAEYYADEIGARAASADALATALHCTLVEARCMEALRASAEATSLDIWEHERNMFHALADHERERLRRIAALHGGRTDALHPPTNLRIERLRSRERGVAAVVLDPTTSARIDGELAPQYRRIREALAPGAKAY